jgi:protein phosphatase
MTRHSTETTIEAAAVSDRGLNERRPLNEDSFFVDLERHVFAVADGVGGAEAGEVASQTAIEVLESAFKHQRDGEDVEDLLEIAIQRANDSIHRMSREHQKFASMATTVVALKVEGLRATVGHVGDSRLYRHTPGGELRRETEDHSVVEEEVRAGRMTPEQAQNHPSRNVISRALGAESDVEVDLKTFEIEPGTTFLLCTDGITRHIPDSELRSLIGGASDLDAACQEMKRLCFERGAEDNLTAVLVRVGGSSAPPAGDDGWDEEQTLIIESRREPSAHAAAENGSRAQETLAPAGDAHAPAHTAPAAPPAPNAHAGQALPATPARKRGGAGRVIFFLLLLLLFSAAAFYGGMFYERRFSTEAPIAASNPPVAAVQPSPSAADAFESERSRVDSGFRTEAERRANELMMQPAAGEDPQFLYLYGRALLLSNQPQEAAVQFEKAAEKIRQQPKSSQMSLLIDAQLANVAARLRANDIEGARRAADTLDTLLVGGANTTTDAAAQPSPPAGPEPSPQQQF